MQACGQENARQENKTIRVYIFMSDLFMSGVFPYAGNHF